MYEECIFWSDWVAVFSEQFLIEPESIQALSSEHLITVQGYVCSRTLNIFATLSSLFIISLKLLCLIYKCFRVKILIMRLGVLILQKQNVISTEDYIEPKTQYLYIKSK